MKKKMEPIILEDYEKIKKNVEEEFIRHVNHNVDEIVSVLDMSDEEIVKNYVKETAEFFHALQEKNKTISYREKRAEKKVRLEYLKEIDKNLGACLRWLDGNKEEDISFIPDIETKREYVGKNREEIVEIVKNDLSENDYVFGGAIHKYEPLDVRVTAIRRMNDLEKAKKDSIKEKMKDFLFEFFSPVIGDALLGTVIGVIFKLSGSSYAESAAILGLITATGFALEIPYYIISRIVHNIKTKKDYTKAKEDLEKAGLYDEVEDYLGRRL